MRLLVDADDEWTDRPTVESTLARLGPTAIIVGKVMDTYCSKAEAMAVDWARAHDVEVETYKVILTEEQLLESTKPTALVSFLLKPAIYRDWITEFCEQHALDVTCVGPNS